jgi:hypothetical protein
MRLSMFGLGALCSTIWSGCVSTSDLMPWGPNNTQTLTTTVEGETTSYNAGSVGIVGLEPEVEGACAASDLLVVFGDLPNSKPEISRIGLELVFDRPGAEPRLQRAGDRGFMTLPPPPQPARYGLNMVASDGSVRRTVGGDWTYEQQTDTAGVVRGEGAFWCSTLPGQYRTYDETTCEPAALVEVAWETHGVDPGLSCQLAPESAPWSEGGLCDLGTLPIDAWECDEGPRQASPEDAED